MRHVLVLNQNWVAIHVWTLERAIKKLFSTYKNGEPKARIIDVADNYASYTWEDWTKLKPIDGEDVLRSPKLTLKVPEVIGLTRYNKSYSRCAKFSRRALFDRDNWTCMYCSKNYPDNLDSDELSIEHILPRSMGGKSTWENCVVACTNCNRKKADRTPEQAGMKLLTIPKKPIPSLLRMNRKKIPKSWSAFISDIYWNVELQP